MLPIVLAACLVLAQFANCDVSSSEERLRNTPPELTQAGQPEPRFLPFSASFSLSAGGNNAHSFSIAGGPDGIGLAQSTSHTSSANDGRPGFSASQSSALAAGLNGISSSDSSSFATNHPVFGSNSHANANSFSLGQATASSHGDVINGQAVAGAQSSVGSTHSQSSSGVHGLDQLRPEGSEWSSAPPVYANGNRGDYYYNSNRKPTLTVSVSDDRGRYGNGPSSGWYPAPEDPRESWRRPDYCNHYNGWYRDPRCRSPKVTVTKPGYRPTNQRPYYESYENRRDPRGNVGKLHISPVQPDFSTQSGPGGLLIDQLSSQPNHGNRRPASLTISRVETSANSQAHAVQHGPSGLQVIPSAGSTSVSSNSGSSAHGTSISSSSGGSYSGANKSVVIFPGPSQHDQIIPKEFVRSSKNLEKKEDGFIDELITDITDAVYDIFDN